MYHGLSSFVLLVLPDLGLVSQHISEETRTPITEILAATALTVSICIATYYLTSWHEISWAIPITSSLFLWQLLGNKHGKVIRM